MIVKDLLLAFSIFVSLYFTFVNVGRVYRGLEVRWPSILLMALGQTSVITHFIGMW